MSNLPQENFIWDLHIHTCECPKGSSEFSTLTVKEYVDTLLESFAPHPDLTMISFTDHNQISSSVYKEFFSRNTDIHVIPGVEVDCTVYIDSKPVTTYKHLIFYFDDKRFDFDRHPKMINDFIKNAKDSNGAVSLDHFLHFLLTNVKIRFLVSPHAWKQGKRGVDYEWCAEEITNRNIDMYLDQFFCFLEASGESDIAKGKEMLEAFERDEKISIIAFSDSNNKAKLEDYLSNPHQFFSAMPSFEGLRMVGSEPRRISKTKTALTDEEKGKYLGAIVCKDGSVVSLSPKMNVIIGGRGSGKSILLESIDLAQRKQDNSSKRDNRQEDRDDYISSLGFSVRMMNGSPLGRDFSFQFFKQNYVYSLFDGISNLTSKPIFKPYFDSLEKADPSKVKNDYIDVLDKPFELICDIDP